MKRRTDRQRDRVGAHVLVCTNGRDSEYACCRDAGSDAVVQAVKTWLRDRDAFWSPIAVTTTGCLGLCSEDGTAIAIQPRNEWYADVTPDDVPALLAREFGTDAGSIDGRAVDAVDSSVS
ncbi:(2Fe-2S) ferredoxin domain-containing protein [Natrarchaeobius halalkaliphilus]|uniref:(2Fe-2S) ferredoxin domain-containing protein n=1 Tax=Natrarchaeobius halalkaliphilus TaxID=1679091 RepID=A0A3N6LIM2_9EURY|nr:(2Fe-2S) ferredoxin domain-containing protein [Natrarchaeobius halalkaliphilus]RQG87079.1 (2Fe-2S) ferredoxin domain-containing protein [Natrarchaeobius halalkaliphilus]